MEYLNGVDPKLQDPRSDLYRCDAADVRSGAICDVEAAVAMCVVSIDIDGVVTAIGVKYLYQNGDEPRTDEFNLDALAELDCVYLQPHNTFCSVAERSGSRGGNSTGGNSTGGSAGGSQATGGGGDGGAGEAPAGVGGSTVAPEPTCEKERCVDEFVTFRASEAATALVVDDAALYWIEDSEGLMKMPLGGGPHEKLADVRGRPGRATTDFPNQITLFDGAIYWVEAFNYDATGAVMSVPTSGGVARPVVEPWCPHALALWDDTLYVATESCYDSASETTIDGTLSMMPASGGELEPLVPLVDHGMVGPFAVDGSGIYFRAFAGLVHMPLEGGEPTPIAQVSSGAWALKDGAVYAAIGGELVAVAADSESLPLASAASPTSIAVAEDAVYWTEDNAIHKVPLEGGETETLVEDQLRPTHLALQGSALYWIVDGKETEQFNGGAIMRLYPR
jgi:hypothetical protein